MKTFFSLFLILITIQNTHSQDLKKLSYAELDSLMGIEYNNGNFGLCIDYMQAGCEKAKAEFGEMDSIYAGYIANLGFFYQQNGQYEKAEPILIQSKNIDAKLLGEDHPLFANSLNNLGVLYYAMGNYDKAEALYLQALGIREKTLGKDDPEYAGSLNNLAELYQAMGIYDKAESLFIQANSIIASTLGEDQPNYATSLNNLAVFYHNIGENEKAEPLYQKAQDLWAKILGKDHPHYAASLNNLATFYFETGQYKKAEPLFLQSKNIVGKAFGTEHPEYSTNLNNLATFYHEIGDLKKAEPLYIQAKNIDAQVLGKEHPSYSKDLNNLANLHCDMRNLETALSYCFQAIAANSSQIDSNFYLRKTSISDWKNLDKFDYYSYQDMNNSIMILLSILQVQYETTKDKNYLETHYEIGKMALRLNERIRNEFSMEGDKLRILTANTVFVRKSLKVALLLEDKKYQEEAFSFAELNKSILLADVVKGHRARTLGDLPDSLIAIESEFQEKLTYLKSQEYQAKTPEEITANNKALTDLNLQIDAFLKSIKNKYPKYHALKYTNITAKTADVQAFLNEKTALLEYFLTDSIAYLFVVTKSDVALHALPIPLDKLKQQIETLRNALSNYKFIVNKEKTAYENYTQTAHWFYKEMVEIAVKNRNLQHLIIVTDGELGHLPFETFLSKPANNQTVEYKDLNYLIKDYSFSYNYSATLLIASQKDENKKKNNGEMLASAATYSPAKSSLQNLRLPYFFNLRQTLEPLPAAQKEIAELSENFSGKFLLGNDANESFFKKNAPDYGVIHLAMHGVLDVNDPMISSLVFTENEDKKEDNFLQAFEVAHLKLNADLVVLSACETGYGKFTQGEGVVSLARSFMYAGVPSLVVSLWQVNDHSTAEIMNFFYTNLTNGMDKAVALQKAKLDYIKISAGIAGHPAFWSPFIQLGDSRPIYLKTKTNQSWWLLGIGLIGSLAIGGFIWKKKR